MDDRTTRPQDHGTWRALNLGRWEKFSSPPRGGIWVLRATRACLQGFPAFGRYYTKYYSRYFRGAMRRAGLKPGGNFVVRNGSDWPGRVDGWGVIIDWKNSVACNADDEDGEGPVRSSFVRSSTEDGGGDKVEATKVADKVVLGWGGCLGGFYPYMRKDPREDWGFFVFHP